MDFFVQNICMTIFFPLWVSLLILVGKFTGTLKSKKMILILTLISNVLCFLASCFVFAKVILNPNFIYENTIPFLSIKNINFEIGCYVDLISSFMLIILFTISLLVQIYAYFYMKNDKSFVRFFTFLNFFIFSMGGLLISPNLFQTYVFWELVGVASYLLIGFWYQKESAQFASKKAFLMNRIGDFCLLAGVIFISVILYNYAPSVDFVSAPFSKLDEIASIVYSYTSEFAFDMICILLFFGAIAKSAQFPLNTWLIDAMEGPTPVSALIHSATMVAAGVYLVARLYPVYYQSTIAMNFIVVIGLITAIICAISAMTCYDLKKILAYSTSSQLGLMFVALGSGALTGGMIYLCSHAFIKSMLFLCAGLIILAFSGCSNIKEMGGLRKKMPILATCFFIGALALCGLMFSGFSSKSIILHQLSQTSNNIILAIVIAISFLTAYYIFRAYFLIFEGKTENNDISVKSNWNMLIPIIILAVIVLFIGFFFPNLTDLKTDLIPIIVELLGIIVAFALFFKRKNLYKLPILYKLSNNGFYIDNFYNYLSVNVFNSITYVANLIDDYIFDGIVIGVAFLIKLKSWICSKIQTGNIQSYLAYSFLLLTILFTGFCIIYSLVAYFVEV